VRGERAARNAGYRQFAAADRALHGVFPDWEETSLWRQINRSSDLAAVVSGFILGITIKL
jgi:hypothetical protein